MPPDVHGARRGGSESLRPVRLQPGAGGAVVGDGRNEDDRPVPSSGDQHAVGVDAQLEGARTCAARAWRLARALDQASPSKIRSFPHASSTPSRSSPWAPNSVTHWLRRRHERWSAGPRRACRRNGDRDDWREGSSGQLVKEAVLPSQPGKSALSDRFSASRCTLSTPKGDELS